MCDLPSISACGELLVAGHRGGACHSVYKQGYQAISKEAI